MALQLTLLRFAARSLLVPETAWRVDKMVWLSAFVLVYLLLNGFNALNVQLKSDGIKPVVSASDLSVISTSSNSSSVAMETNATHVVPESTPGNAVTNTVLRTAVTPHMWILPDSKCQSSISRYEIDESSTDDSVAFGFPIRSWVGQMLPQAPPAQTLEISLLDGSSATPTTTQLPMNASQAAMLLIEGVSHAAVLADLFTHGAFPVTASVNASAKQGAQPRLPVARANGLLPPTDTNDEAQERSWLLDAIPKLLKAQFKLPQIGNDPVTKDDTESGVSVRFSHVDLSDRIKFDAVTIDGEVNTYKYTSALDADGKTRYFTWLDVESSCGPKPASICAVEKMAHGNINSAYYDIPSSILAGSICLNADGTETQISRFKQDSTAIVATQECNTTSTSSMIVVSIAKRIVADSVIEAETARTKSAKLKGNSTRSLSYPVLVNARKIYSVTVGRLAWKTQDLAGTFGAKCRADSSSKCEGLQFPLASSGKTNVSEVIVAGTDALPINALGSISWLTTARKATPLVRVREPIRYGTSQKSYTYVYSAVAGDILLPHNLLVNRSRTISGDQCLTRMDERLNNVLTNHLYMEDGLQPAYTSAMFFLFQHGVVKQAVNMTNAVQTLSFDMNIQVSALVASIPKANVYQSLAGCAMLLVGVLFTVFYSSALLADEDSNTASASSTGSVQESEKLQLAKVSDPRVIAQVMLDDGRFPPMFLERKIVDASGHVSTAEMATFQIASMTLSTDADDGKRVVVERGDNKAARVGGIV